MLFLFSSIFSYISLRSEGRARFSGFSEQVADNLFLVAFIGLTMIAVVFAYELL